VRELWRKYPQFFFWTVLAGLALRLLFVFASPQITDDSRIYADIAKNWLTHGLYGTTGSGTIVPTYIRLPGYPAFLAIIFAVFGRDNFRAVLLIQVLVDLGTYLLVADLTRRTSTTETQRHREQSSSDRATKAAFLLAALCPFLANYSAAVLTETLEVFFTVLALDLAVIGLNRMGRLDQRTDEPSNSAAEAANEERPDAALKRWSTRPTLTPLRVRVAWVLWAGCGLAIAAAILLRPDGGILLIAVGLYLAWLAAYQLLARGDGAWPVSTGSLIGAGVLVSIFALAPLVPWTVRNLHTMHEFQPLAPRYANNPGDYVPVGFNRWVRTWMADYVSTQEIYWQVPGAEIDPTKLPSRAFDAPEQRQQTYEILTAYNQTKQIGPDLDARFAQLARQRIAGAPLRYYAWLPLVRIVDMWMRPRTELLPVDPRWWEFDDDLKWSVTAVGFGVLNLVYVLMAFAGLFSRHSTRWLSLLVLFVVLRSVFLGTLENPEPRYTLECYPVVIVLGAAAVARYLGTHCAAYENP
jgi:hypothetical protein